MKPILLIFILIFGTAFLSISFKITPSFHKLSSKVNYQLPGQTVPSDMVFIAGNGNFESVYISVTKEPNINYVIYLQWLISVFYESYPDVFFNALPNAEDTIILDNGKVSCPVYEYMTHPDYAYYPMIGLTWEQIQRYLAWKTDRLNEEILIKGGFLNRNFNQKDKDNFVTSAYLTGYYQGSVKSNIPYTSYSTHAGKRKKERPVVLNDGILFTGFRLPTAQEWEYAKEHYTVAAKPFTPKIHPFGNNHFLLNSPRERNKKNLPLISYRRIPIDTLRVPTAILNYNVDNYINSSEKKTSSNFKNIIPKNNYNQVPATYGAIQFENDVAEWVLDRYETNQVANKDWRAILADGGFNMEHPAIKDENGKYVRKGSFGHLINFRFIGIGSSGIPFEVDRYSKNKGLQHQLNQLNVYVKSLKDYVDKYPSYAPIIKKKELEIQKLKQKIRLNSNINRVIKGGKITHLRDDKFSNDIGFRTVLPFTGAPVLKGAKVKWK